MMGADQDLEGDGIWLIKDTCDYNYYQRNRGIEKLVGCVSSKNLILSCNAADQRSLVMLRT